MSKRLTGTALVAYLRQFPSSDDRGWTADEIETLTSINNHQANLNEAAHAEIARLRIALEHCVAWLPENCSAACEARAALGDGDD